MLTLILLWQKEKTKLFKAGEMFIVATSKEMVAILRRWNLSVNASYRAKDAGRNRVLPEAKLDPVAINL